MKKILSTVATVAVGLAAFYGVRELKQKAVNREPTAAELQQKMDALKERAVQEHPGMAKSDAIKEQASAESATKLATQTPQQQLSTAADMFWGFYFMNTRARVNYCTARGVDLSPFVTAFEKVHHAEYTKARAVYDAAGVNPESLVTKLLPAFAGTIEQDMKDVTTGAGVPLDQACGLFNDNAEQIAGLLQLPPHVEKALMAN